MLFLIGVDHIVQHLSEGSSPQKAALVTEFADHLKKAAKEVGAELLAEEFSADALRISNVHVSTIQRVAAELQIHHLFCDPTQDERNELGILKEDRHRRELFWLECIRDFKDKNIIFVCGNTHLDSFALLLTEEGFQMRVYSQGWGVSFWDS